MSLKKIGLSFLLGTLAQFARTDISAEIGEASAPLAQGVPEVAVARLQALLNKNLPETEWRVVAEKLAEAQVTAREPENTLVLLADPRLRGLPWAKFWRAQALAGVNRWASYRRKPAKIPTITGGVHTSSARKSALGTRSPNRIQ